MSLKTSGATSPVGKRMISGVSLGMENSKFSISSTRIACTSIILIHNDEKKQNEAGSQSCAFKQAS